MGSHSRAEEADDDSRVPVTAREVARRVGLWWVWLPVVLSLLIGVVVGAVLATVLW